MREPTGRAVQSRCSVGFALRKGPAMADLGKPIRVIEVQPLEHPVPREAPAPESMPVEVPEPVKVPS